MSIGVKKAQEKIKQAQDKVNCDFCGQHISYHKIKCITKIINVQQNPTVLYFCNKECKLSFIANIKKRSKRNE